MDEHLSDTVTYENISDNTDVISDINSKIKSWAVKYSEAGDISSKIADNIVKPSSRPGYDYGNYKAHKPEADYPLRVITSGCGSPLEGLANFLE